jgi:hypothetical protein
MICRPQSGADEKSPGGDVSTPIEVPDRCTGPTGSQRLLRVVSHLSWLMSGLRVDRPLRFRTVRVRVGSGCP